MRSNEYHNRRGVPYTYTHVTAGEWRVGYTGPIIQLTGPRGEEIGMRRQEFRKEFTYAPGGECTGCGGCDDTEVQL